MNIKSLLIGSAAAMAVSTGAASAADAIVYAEPEPVEYVRVCDVYGAGFFYIPGTETCLKFSGYYRFELANTAGWAGYTTFARFQLNTDVRSETEWGTLRGYAEARFDYGFLAAGAALPSGAVTAAAGYSNRAYLNQGFIELMTGSGTLRLGKSDTPYARFLGYGSSFGPFDGTYAFRNANELSFTFTGGNGFSAIIAVIDNVGSNTWATDIAGGINWSQGWGSIGAIAGWDSVAGTWGIKGAARFTAPNSGISAGLLVMYASGAGVYAITDPGAAAAAGAHWSVLGYVKGQFTPKVAAAVAAQWFDYSGGWVFTGGLDLKPVAGLQIQPEIQYRTSNATWWGVIRVIRTF